MTLQLSINAENARLDAMIGMITTPAILRIFDGTIPASCLDPDIGSILVEIILPIPYMLSASSGSISKTGTWEQLSATASGIASYFRIFENTGLIAEIQGTVSLSGDGGDMILDSLNITMGQDVLIGAFSIADGNM